MLAWGLYFIVFATVFESLGTVQLGFFTLNQFIIIILFILAIPYRFMRKGYFYKIAALDVSLLIFGGYLWISNYLISPDSTWGFRVVTHYLRSMTCYFLVVFLVIDREKLKWLIYTYIVSSVSMILTANILNIIHGGIHYAMEDRQGLIGRAGHYINYAMYAFMSVPLAYFVQKSSDMLMRKTIMWIVIILLSLAGLFSGSRGAIITFGFMVALIIIIDLIWSSQISIRQLVMFAFASIAIFCLFWFKGGSNILGSLMPIFTGKGRLDYSLSGRIYLYKANVKLFIKHPLLGVGVDVSRHILGNVTHNQWLQILSELGIVGMALAIGITVVIGYYYWSTIRILIHRNDRFYINVLKGTWVSIVTLLMWGMYENIGYIQASKVLFMLFGIMRSLRTLVKEESPDVGLSEAV